MWFSSLQKATRPARSSATRQFRSPITTKSPARSRTEEARTMADELWGWDELVRAANGVADGTPTGAISGLSIDSRSVAPGDVFVALKDVRDGHDFVTTAFERGAAAALVSDSYVRKPHDGALIR